MVITIYSAVQYYTLHYLASEPYTPRFLLLQTGFLLSMLLLILSDHLLLLFLG